MKHEHQGVEGYVAWFYLLSNFHRTRGNEFYYGRKKHDLFIYPSIWPKSEGGGGVLVWDLIFLHFGLLTMFPMCSSTSSQ
jgi:hypothetical protein